jgi:hypothetical protein
MPMLMFHMEEEVHSSLSRMFLIHLKESMETTFNREGVK